MPAVIFKMSRHFWKDKNALLRFLCIKRKDTKEEQKKAEACGPHRDLRVPDADQSLSILEKLECISGYNF
jgi:hypothetical protein